MSTQINVVGTVATEPKLLKSSSGVPLCSFRLASDERRYDRDQQLWVEGNTNWFGVVAFRGLAEHAHSSFQKGDRVIVSGKLRIRNWEKEDRRGVSVEIEAEALGHDLRWGVSHFEKLAQAKASSTADDDVQGPDSAGSDTPAAAHPAAAEHEDTATADAAGESPSEIGWPSSQAA